MDYLYSSFFYVVFFGKIFFRYLKLWWDVLSNFIQILRYYVQLKIYVKFFIGIVIIYIYVFIYVRKMGENLDKNFLSIYIYIFFEI